MKQTKTCKIILLFTAAVLFIVGILSLFTNTTKAYASNSDILSKSFGGTTTRSFSDDKLNVEVENGETLIFYNDLLANSLDFDFAVTEKITKINATFSIAALDVNADKIEAELVINFAQNKFGFNEATETYSSFEKLSFKVEDNLLKASVDGAEFISLDTKVSSVGKIVGGGEAFVMENLTFTFTATEKTTVPFTSITMCGDEQNFVFDSSNITRVMEKAVIANKNIAFNGDKAIVKEGSIYTLNVSLYSVLKDYASVSPFIKSVPNGDGYNVWVNNSSKLEFALFNGTTSATLSKTDEEDFGTIDFEFVSTDEESAEYKQAPTYNLVDEYIESFAKKLDKNLYSDYEGKIFNRLGASITVPSFGNLVSDNYTTYSSLAFTLYYKTPYTTGSTGSLSLSLDRAGEYTFYVIYKDAQNNVMVESEDVDSKIEANEFVDSKVYDDVGVITRIVDVDGIEIPTFTFRIEDNAPISVKGISQTDGYVGNTYTASSFDIQSSGYTTSYQLYYNANVLTDSQKVSLVKEDLTNANGWYLIPAISKAEVNGTFEGDFTYTDIENIAYDGSLTFTPDREGTYAIKCTVTSSSYVREAYDIVAVSVSEEVEVVKPATHWLENNIWSVVFLSVGTLCLIAVIVLLFIKPKEDKEKEDEE